MPACLLRVIAVTLCRNCKDLVQLEIFRSIYPLALGKHAITVLFFVRVDESYRWGVKYLPYDRYVDVNVFLL
jgi:hypothetical protein